MAGLPGPPARTLAITVGQADRPPQTRAPGPADRPPRKGAVTARPADRPSRSGAVTARPADRPPRSEAVTAGLADPRPDRQVGHVSKTQPGAARRRVKSDPVDCLSERRARFLRVACRRAFPPPGSSPRPIPDRDSAA